MSVDGMHTFEDVRASVEGGRTLMSVGLSARVRMAVQALNNEGSRNNATMPRQVDVVSGGDVIQVNAISGDTIKHSFTDYLLAVIEGRHAANDSLPVSEACRLGDPNRLNADREFQAFASKKEHSNADILREILLRCTVTDVAGLLVTQGSRNTPRRSTVQFGWQLGVPDHVRTGRYTHVKLVPADPTGGAERAEGSNLGQNLFTKPASSGIYAFVASCDLDRIGRNDITRKREIPDEAWRERTSVVLEALFQTIALPGGAQRNTQLPHVHGVEGALAVSVSHLAPVICSPLEADYAEQMAKVAGAFGRAGRDHFVLPFADLAELGTQLSALSGLVRAG